MKNSLRIAALAGAAALLQLPAAHALSLVDSVLNGNTAGTDFSTPDTVAVDIGFNAPGSVVLTYEVDAADIDRGSALFNSIVDNFTASPFGTLSFALDAGKFVPGGFISNDGTATATIQQDRLVSFTFTPALVTQAYVGDPFFDGAGENWFIRFDGMTAGERISLSVTAAVPEPETWALLAAGLGILAMSARRRRQAG